MLTDSEFSLESFVEKIDSLIETTPELAMIADTSFVVIASATFSDVHLSASRSGTKLLSEEEFKGLGEDELSVELSELVSKGVNSVTNHLK